MVEIIQVTTEVIKQEIYKIAGGRMIDPPPKYSTIENNENKQTYIDLEIEKERTKQKQVELEIKKIEYEMLKLNFRI